LFIGGDIRGRVEYRHQKDNTALSPEEDALGKGNVFATGLVAGGAVAGVLIAFLAGSAGGEKFLGAVSTEHAIVSSMGEGGYFLLGTVFFALMGWILYRVATRK
ncbi:MAG: peptide transporter, partial [bacterium]